jgi:oligopeptidase B
MPDQTPPIPPRAEKRPSESTHHGHTRVDDYAWLRDANWQRVMRDPAALDPDIRAYLEAENAYTDAVMAETESLRGRLFAEMKGRIKEVDSSVPLPDGPWDYLFRYVEGGQHPQLCRRPRGGGEEQLLLDGDAMAQGQPYFRFGGVSHSPDHRLLAYSTDTAGGEFYTLRVLDMETGDLLEDTVPDTGGSPVWSADGRTVYYIRRDDANRPRWVYRHRIGTDASGDEMVFEESNPAYFVGLDRTESGRFIMISSADHSSGEIRFMPADGSADPVLIAPRRPNVEYDVTHHGARFLIRTNADGAEDFAVFEAPIDAPGPENWRALIPHEAGRHIRMILVFANHLVRLERARALPRIVVRRLSDGAEHTVAFDEEAFDLGLIAGYEYDTTTLRLTYSSPTTPRRTYDYDMESRERVLLKEQEVPSGHDPDAYVVQRLFAPGHDGVEIPVTVLRRKDQILDGTAPLYLYGYGSYGISMPDYFDTVPYAVAHIRGGSEMGRRWYLDGKMEKKENSFRDFISVAEHLIAEGYTAKGRIAANGRSAGGMLVGAIANMRPDLFGSIAGEVPFVDCLTTILDASLPLTPPEWTEWGNPIESEAVYRAMLSYSPYDNVTAQPYPDILATGGLTDPRVTYWEPAKWAAKLREMNTADSTILLWINMEAGHGGAAGRFDRLKEIALTYAFFLRSFGMIEAEPKR